jgi:iron(III) transport system ATP-binding protein
MTTNQESIFDVRGVSFSYTAKKKQLLEVDLSIKAGEIVSLVGPSGSGKSTLLRVIAGLEQQSAGIITLCGKEIQSLSPQQRGVGVCFQSPTLLPHLTVLENVCFVMAEEDVSYAQELLKKIGLSENIHMYPDTLSGGQQQRVAIARALAMRPDILLFDEAFANLDVLLKEQIRDDILALIRQSGIPALFITHDPSDALHLSDTIYVIENGKIVQSGSAKELYEKPQSVFVARFFGELNLVEGSVYQKHFRCAYGSYPLNKADDGKTISSLYIRPEFIKLSKKKKKGLQAVRVKKVAFLGVEAVVSLCMDETGQLLKAKVVGDSSLPMVGDTVFVDFDHYFIF